jgi:hypothetical protein
MIFAPGLARSFFTTSAVSPPAEDAPATISAAVAMHAGHMGSSSHCIVERAAPRSTPRVIF